MSDDACEHWRVCDYCVRPGVLADRDRLLADVARLTRDLIQAQEDHRAALESLETYEASVRALARHVFGQVPDGATIVLLDAIVRRLTRERDEARAEAFALSEELASALAVVHAARAVVAEGHGPRLGVRLEALAAAVEGCEPSGNSE